MMQDAIAVTYEDSVNWLRKIVWLYIKRYNRWLEFDELFSRANLHFMQAYYSYDYEEGEFSTWLYIKVWHGLLDDDNLEYRHYRNKLRPERACVQKRFGWQNIDIIDELGEDSKNLLSLFCELPEDLEMIFERSKSKSNHRIIFRYLKENGWSREQIQSSFRDIKQIFSKNENQISAREIKQIFS